MIRRSTRIAIEAIIGLLAAGALLAGMALWRLSAGPVQVDFLTPYLEAVFAETKSGLSVEVGETVLSWEGWSRTIDLRTRQVRIRDAAGTTVAVLPDVSIALSLRALLRGTVAPTEIEVIDARVSLIRDADGRFQMAANLPADGGETGDAEPEFSGLVPALLDLFLRDPDPNSPLGYLAAARVLDGRLIVIDRRLQTVWRAPSANMELRRHAGGVAAFMGLKLALGESTTDADLAILYDHLQRRIDVAARVSGLRPAALAAAVPSFEFLEGIKVPIEANASAVLDPEGTFRSLKFDATGGAGEMALPLVLPDGRAVTGLSVRGVLDRDARRLEVQSAELRFGDAQSRGPTFTASAVVDGLGGDLEIVAEARADELAIEDLEHYWTTRRAPNARKWAVERIHGGAGRNGTLNFAARVPGGEPQAIEITRLDGGFDFQGLAVVYVKGMPPLTEVRGRATYDRTALHFQLTGGRLGELEISEGKVDILGLKAEGSRAEIEGDVAGPLPEALHVLNHERLQLVDQIGVRPSEASGLAEAHLVFRFPLLKDLVFKDVDFSAAARIERGSVASFLLDRDGSEMQLVLEADQHGMTATGPLKLAGVLAELQWRQDFTGQAEQESLVKLDFPSVNTAGRRDLGLDLTPFVEGPVSVSTLTSVKHDGSGTLDVAANLIRAHLSLPFLHWEKAPDIAGQARLSLVLQDKKVTAIDRFDVQAGTLLARGRANLLSGRLDFQNIQLDQLALRGTTLQKVMVIRDRDGFLIDLGQGVLDATAFLEDEEAEETAGPGPQAGANEAKTPLDIQARALSSVYFGKGRYLKGVDLSLERSANGWERVTLRGEVPEELWARKGNGGAPKEGGEVPEARTVILEFAPSGLGDYRLAIMMNDMGAALRALDVIDTVEGGSLLITGVSPGPAPEHVIEGRIEAQDYKLREAPVMAQLLSLASLSGIADVLSGEGLDFRRLVGDFRLEDGVARTELLRAYGGALGLTAKGTVDFAAEKVDLQGTVVPAYTVNRILGGIPLLGRLLVGGKGEGVVAITYRIDGAIADPEVSVNPLSVLTPGFLRGLFGVPRGDGGEGEDEAPRPSVFPPRADR